MRTHLALRIGGEKLAVEVCGDNNPTRSGRVLGGYDIREALLAVRRRVRKAVLLNMPVELLQSRDKVVLDKSVVGCIWRTRYKDLGQVGRRVCGVDVTDWIRRLHERRYCSRRQCAEVALTEFARGDRR